MSRARKKFLIARGMPGKKTSHTTYVYIIEFEISILLHKMASGYKVLSLAVCSDVFY